MIGVTTAPVVVCKSCGTVSHIEGGVQPSQIIHSVCGGNPRGHHSWITVIALVPYA